MSNTPIEDGWWSEVFNAEPFGSPCQFVSPILDDGNRKVWTENGLSGADRMGIMILVLSPDADYRGLKIAMEKGMEALKKE